MTKASSAPSASTSRPPPPPGCPPPCSAPLDVRWSHRRLFPPTHSSTIHQIEATLQFARHRPVVHTFEQHILNQAPEMVAFCKANGIAPRAHVCLAKGDVFESACLQRDDMSAPQVTGCQPHHHLRRLCSLVPSTTTSPPPPPRSAGGPQVEHPAGRLGVLRRRHPRPHGGELQDADPGDDRPPARRRAAAGAAAAEAVPDVLDEHVRRAPQRPPRVASPGVPRALCPS